MLWIDPATGKVVDHRSADQQKADFTDFLQKQKQGVAWDDKMKRAKEEEAKRKKEIEEKFKKAKDEKPEGKPEPHSPFDWD